MKDFLIRAKPERLVYPKNAGGRLASRGSKHSIQK